MSGNFMLATIISVVYFLLKFLEMRTILKETKPIKDLLKETMLVYVSVLAGDFVLKQVGPAASELTTESTGAFTNDPNF